MTLTVSCRMDQLIVDFLLLLYSRCIVLIIVLLREYVDFPERLRKYITRFPRLAMVSVRFAVFSIVTYATAYLYSAIYIIPSIIILPFSIKYCRIFIERLYIGPYFGFYTVSESRLQFTPSMVMVVLILIQSNLSIPDTLGPKNCPDYRGVLISQVHLYTFILQWDHN